MNRKIQITAEFDDQPGFPVGANPEEPRPNPKDFEGEFAQLQERLLENAFSHTETLSLYGALRQAASEAAGIAWTTEFPLLVYPALFDEKTRTLRQHAQRQQRIAARTHALVEEVSA